MTREERDRIDRLESALRVIWTWANFDRAHGYRALVPEHVAETCKAALAAQGSRSRNAEECETMICPRCLRENPAEIHTCQATPAWHKLESEIAEMRRENSRLRAELAEANDYINRLRDMLTDSHPCIDPSRDACNCILCELVIRERQQAALAAKEGE